jgi:hypothetical protein
MSFWPYAIREGVVDRRGCVALAVDTHFDFAPKSRVARHRGRILIRSSVAHLLLWRMSDACAFF